MNRLGGIGRILPSKTGSRSFGAAPTRPPFAVTLLLPFLLLVILLAPADAQQPAFAPSAPPAPSYNFTQLQNLGGLVAEARAINEAGQIAGFSQISPNGDNHAVLWNDGVPVDLHPAGPASISLAFGINDRSQVVGQVVNLAPFEGRATVWNGTAAQRLDSRGGHYDIAFAINDRGHAVGFTTPASILSPEPTIWRNNVASPLGTLGGTFGEARAINQADQAVGGSSATGNSPILPTLWTGGAIVGLGTLGGPGGIALAINERGQIAGWSETAAGTPHASLWERTAGGHRVIDLGASIRPAGSSFAYGINDLGQVVGQVGNSLRDLRAVLWADGRAIDLNAFLDPRVIASGIVLSSANDINDQGTIVGTTFDLVTGEINAYVLTPIVEPAVAALLLVGLCLLALHAGRGARARRRTHGTSVYRTLRKP